MASTDYTKSEFREAAAVRQASKRRCTDCGKPTHNYRCEKCWKKRRGFGFEGSGEVSGLQKEDDASFRRAKAEAGQRREKPVPAKPDTFVPMTPRPALPDRQAEFFAKQENRMEKKNYTIKELAALLGVSPKDVANAKYVQNKEPRPGSNIAAIRDGMTARGITWDQVVTAPRGKSAGTDAASGTPDPADDPSNTLASDLATVVADMEPEDTPPPVSQRLPLGQAMARELSIGELEEDAAKRLTGHGPVPGSIGTAMSLEEILGELRRRLPGAAISITLPCGQPPVSFARL